MTRRDEVVPAVVEAIAEANGCRPADLDFSLYEHVDTAALTELVVSKQTDWTLTFQVPNCSVEIHGDGRICVGDTVQRNVEGASGKPNAENQL